MNDNVAIAIIASSAAALGSFCVLGAAIFAVIVHNKRLDDIRGGLKELTDEFRAFKELIHSKLSAIDNELGNIWDKVNKP